MSNEQKNSRAVIEDLPDVEKKMTEKEMEKVKGGAPGDPVGGVDVGIRKKPSGSNSATSAASIAQPKDWPIKP